MQFGDRVLYDSGSSNTLGVYLKEISSHEALVKLDGKKYLKQDLLFKVKM